MEECQYEGSCYWDFGHSLLHKGNACFDCHVYHQWASDNRDSMKYPVRSTAHLELEEIATFRLHRMSQMVDEIKDLKRALESSQESWHAVRTRAAIENNGFRKDIKFGNKQIVWLNNELEETKRIKDRWKAQAKKRDDRIKVLKDELAVGSVFDALLGFIDLSRMR